MHVPFSENHPCVLTDRKRTETRPNSEGQAPVDVATARCVASCFMNKPAAALRAFSFGKTGEIVGIHRRESPASGQFDQRPACRSSVEKAMVVTDNGKEMANEFYDPPFATGGRSLPVHGHGSGSFDRADSLGIRGKYGLGVKRVSCLYRVHLNRLPHTAGTAPPFVTYASDIPRPRGVGKSMLGPPTYWHGFVGGTPRKQSFRGRHDADLIRTRQLP